MVTIVSTAYFPPIQFFSKLANYDKVLLEAKEHFVKSSFRNRCYIAGPNGLLRLTIPIKGGKIQQRIPIKKIEIDNDDNWKKIHWKSFCSCYQRSPYFEYYEDQFKKAFFQQYSLLFDWNLHLINVIIEMIDLTVNLEFTNSYEKEYSFDFRTEIHPKRYLTGPDLNFKPPKYIQVFEDRLPFLPNLSIIDLLFCEGPNTKPLLMSSFVER